MMVILSAPKLVHLKNGVKYELMKVMPPGDAYKVGITVSNKILQRHSKKFHSKKYVN